MEVSTKKWRPPFPYLQIKLQNLALESQTKGPDDIPDPATARKPVIVTSKSKSYHRSKAPLRKNFMDPSACYLPNGYTSFAYYYKGSLAGIGIRSGWPGSSPSSSAVPSGVDLNTPPSLSPNSPQSLKFGLDLVGRVSPIS
ncbi:hypothetical protein C1H46_002134 [Malus baccata]|uniref:Uncharacterized protein n=1 Tax=Malus baccata TaxID=106549 RepID=A0A540NMF8_MALBA|nr:hypothetical protein C1H46_002134 [Malus baccata]